ncbi:hypothetical protein SAMN05428949_5025 [Chitinophaga sp. YR627]|nr:hypothetical protein SAMN05428949_5025 [Chitinophaga sp. YR627]
MFFVASGAPQLFRRFFIYESVSLKSDINPLIFIICDSRFFLTFAQTAMTV